MVNIDPKIQPLTFGKKKKKILGLIPGSKIIEKKKNLRFELVLLKFKAEKLFH